MTRLTGADPEAISEIQSMVLEIFADLTNAGYPLQQVLLAIYLSGLQHATSILAKRGTSDEQRTPQGS
jgi:hypothetical protein